MVLIKLSLKEAEEGMCQLAKGLGENQPVNIKNAINSENAKLQSEVTRISSLMKNYEELAT